MKITFKRLPHNTLPLPAYATEGSAAFDLCACLERPCVKPKQDPNSLTVSFYNNDGRRWFTEERPANTNPPALFISSGETILVPTGFSSSFKDSVLKLYIRSSMSIKGLVLANSVGVIDSDYRGEILLAIKNTSARNIMIEHGQRLAQGILEKLERCVLEEGTVDVTERGAGGFGSTGSK